MKTEKDLYKVLGVSETSSKEEIDRQYRKLAAKYHPDRFSEDNEKKDAEKQFENISQAYNVLSNEKSRSEYNARRKFGFDQRRSNNSQFNQFDFEDLNSSGSNWSDFSNVFEEFFNPGHEKAKGSERGEDILINLTISLKDLVLGSKKSFKLELLRSCSECSQTGAYAGTSLEICFYCKGKGVVESIEKTLFGTFKVNIKCNKCNGIGKIITKKCNICRGSKLISVSELIEVEIPKGIKPEQRIIIENKGNDGIGTRKRSRIIIEVKLKSDPLFQIKNNDIYTSVPISFLDAILGKKIKIITIEDIKEIEIPKYSQVNDVITVKNKGLFITIGKSVRGNLYVKLEIKLPKKVSFRIEKIIFDIREETSWNPNDEFIKKNRDKLNWNNG
jgi:molecular chaperone DnaJ